MKPRRVSALHRTALVTGASAGLGQAFAAMLRAEGVRVWGTARDPGRLAAAENFTPLALDLARPEDAAAAFAQADRAAGGFDLVINNAGYGVLAGFAEAEFSLWQGQVETMLAAPMRLGQLALRGMRARRRGCLVNVSSLAVEFPLPFMSGYNTVKAGLSAFSESLMIEVAGSGVTVLDFRPGDYRTNFNQAMHRPALATDAAPRVRRVWDILEANLRAAPPPARAAADLRRALLRRRSGTVRSGSWFQAGLAPLLAAGLPAALRRAVLARYFGSH